MVGGWYNPEQDIPRFLLFREENQNIFKWIMFHTFDCLLSPFIVVWSLTRHEKWMQTPIQLIHRESVFFIGQSVGLITWCCLQKPWFVLSFIRIVQVSYFDSCHFPGWLLWVMYLGKQGTYIFLGVCHQNLTAQVRLSLRHFGIACWFVLWVVVWCCVRVWG